MMYTEVKLHGKVLRILKRTAIDIQTEKEKKEVINKMNNIAILQGNIEVLHITYVL